MACIAGEERLLDPEFAIANHRLMGSPFSFLLKCGSRGVAAACLCEHPTSPKDEALRSVTPVKGILFGRG